MGKMIVTMWITLDGFVAGPDGDMDWISEMYDEAMGTYEYDLVSAADALMLGRGTYQSFAGSWPKVPDTPNASPGEVAYAHRVNAMRKIVVSRTLEKADWHNSTLLRDIVPEEIEKLKQEPGGDIVIYGSVSIIQALTNLGLIDEYQLLIYPIILGSGKRLFEHIKDSMHLKLVNTKTHPSGVVVLYYQPNRK